MQAIRSLVVIVTKGAANPCLRALADAAAFLHMMLEGSSMLANPEVSAQHAAQRGHAAHVAAFSLRGFAHRGNRLSLPACGSCTSARTTNFPEPLAGGHRPLNVR